MLATEPFVFCSSGPRSRIVFLDHTAELSGGEIALLNLIKHLDRKRFDPVVVLFSDGPLRKRLTQQNIETRILPLSADVIGVRKDNLGAGTLTKVLSLARSLTFIIRLARLLRELKPDLVHTNSLKADILGGAAARYAGIPVIWHVRDRIDAQYLPGKVASIFRKLCRLIPTFIVANSRATLETLRLGPPSNNGHTSLNGDGSAYARVVHDGTEVQPPLLSDDGMNDADNGPITLVGRISPWKGQHIFVQAAAIVRKSFPDARFRIAGSALFGETDYEAQVRTLVSQLQLEDCIEFTGFREDVAGIIRQSRMLVHASTIGEPFGQVIIEAMAAERPVVATNGGGVREIVVDGETGILVPMGDVPAMAAAICRLLRDQELSHRIRRAGRQRLLDHFTIQNTARHMEKVFQDVLTSSTK